MVGGIDSVRRQSQIEVLTLLGRLYPDNVVVVNEGQSITQALAAGKAGFPDAGRFVIVIGK